MSDGSTGGLNQRTGIYGRDTVPQDRGESGTDEGQEGVRGGEEGDG